MDYGKIFVGRIIGIFYGSTIGCTESAAEAIQEQFNSDQADIGLNQCG